VELGDYSSIVVPRQVGLGVMKMATISDVAAHAGVGIGTVSRVLNGSDQVRPATRDKVHAAMEELDYHPSRSTAGNRSKRQGLVGVLVPFFDEPSSYQRLRGIVQSLQPHDLEIVLYNVDTPDHAHRRLLEVPRHQLEGLIILSLPLRLGALSYMAEMSTVRTRMPEQKNASWKSPPASGRSITISPEPA